VSGLEAVAAATWHAVVVAAPAVPFVVVAVALIMREVYRAASLDDDR
jgi:hypothetical protein